MNNAEINTIYSCCQSSPWLKVINKLKEEQNIVPSYFIGWKDDNNQQLHQNHPTCFYQTIQDAWKGLGFPKLDYTFEVDEKTLKKFAFEELVALQMMDRLDITRHSFSLADRKTFFYNLLKYWLVVIEQYNIKLVISPSVPHRIFDYVLYVAAKIKGIDFIMFQMTSFGDSSFIIDTIDHTPIYLKQNIHMKNANISLKEDILSKINDMEKDYKKAIPDYMVKQQEMLNISIEKQFESIIKTMAYFVRHPFVFRNDNDTYLVKRGMPPSDSSLSKFETRYLKFKNKLYLKSLEKKYKSLCTIFSSRKYVLVALHYQPEETSCPTGGLYADQQLIVELLNNFLDTSYDIIVKEHKTQFNPHYEGATGRSKSFYTNILKISNRVKFISTEEDTFKLISKATATATISGTIGWESVMKGTPALVFGRAWYEDMPGVFKIKSREDLVLIWDQVLSMKNTINKNQIYNYHCNLQQFLINANHYSAFSNKVDRTEEENSLNIYNGIIKHLRNINFFYNSNKED